MPALPWGEQGGLGLGWQGRGQAEMLRPSCPGCPCIPACPGCPWTRGDQGWAGPGVASPAGVRAGRRGPCPRGGDQGFAGSLETELMYLQMMMEILFLFVLFCF